MSNENENAAAPAPANQKRQVAPLGAVLTTDRAIMAIATAVLAFFLEGGSGKIDAKLTAIHDDVRKVESKMASLEGKLAAIESARLDERLRDLERSNAAIDARLGVVEKK
jgi:hypothetical protein